MPSSAVALPAPAPFDDRQLVLDLHAFLNDLEPARWRDEKEALLRQRYEDLHLRFEQLASHYAASAEEHRQNLHKHATQMSEFLAAHRPHLDSFKSLDEARAAWMAFRASAEPAYESLVKSLKSENIVLPSLRPTNYTRNLFHVGSAMFGLLLGEFMPGWTSLGGWLVLIVAVGAALSGWSMELGRRMSPKINSFLMWLFSLVSHPHEAHHVNSATWYVTSLALLSLTFNPLVCSAALAVLGFADPAAAIIGKRWGKHRFENGRSLEGTLAFIAVGALAAIAAMLVFHGQLPLWRMGLIAVAASSAGGITELLSKRLDDNLGIPVSAGLAAWAMWGLTGLLV